MFDIAGLKHDIHIILTIMAYMYTCKDALMTSDTLHAGQLLNALSNSYVQLTDIILTYIRMHVLNLCIRNTYVQTSYCYQKRRMYICSCRHIHIECYINYTDD